VKRTNKSDPVLDELMFMMSRYTDVELERAEAAVKSHFTTEPDLEFALGIILRNLRFAKTRGPQKKRKLERTASNTKKRRSQPMSDDVPTDALLRELRAILSDEAFLHSKQELADFEQRYFHEIMSPPPKGDSIEEILAQFQKAAPEQQRTIFKGVRAAYLKSRGSSLPGWSELIRGQEK
jgi:hypothetical protein